MARWSGCLCVFRFWGNIQLLPLNLVDGRTDRESLALFGVGTNLHCRHSSLCGELIRVFNCPVDIRGGHQTTISWRRYFSYTETRNKKALLKETSCILMDNFHIFFVFYPHIDSGDSQEAFPSEGGAFIAASGNPQPSVHRHSIRHSTGRNIHW